MRGGGVWFRVTVLKIEDGIFCNILVSFWPSLVYELPLKGDLIVWWRLHDCIYYVCLLASHNLSDSNHMENGKKERCLQLEVGCKSVAIRFGRGVNAIQWYQRHSSPIFCRNGLPEPLDLIDPANVGIFIYSMRISR